MSLAAEYARQFQWRSWQDLFQRLPSLDGKTVLDLGCGPGDVAAELERRDAHVIGVDGNPDLIAACREKKLIRAEFHVADLRSLPTTHLAGADGIWCSFAAAYFVELHEVLRQWRSLLRADGWIALTEIDHLFGHEPLGARTRALLEAYARNGLEQRRYDFQMGRKLRGHLEQAGFAVSMEADVPDREFAFQGPADADVLRAWERRWQRMHLLQQFCGDEFDAVRGDFLDCLARADHRSLARVRFCLARKTTEESEG